MITQNKKSHINIIASMKLHSHFYFFNIHKDLKWQPNKRHIDKYLENIYWYIISNNKRMETIFNISLRQYFLSLDVLPRLGMNYFLSSLSHSLSSRWQNLFSRSFGWLISLLSLTFLVFSSSRERGRATIAISFHFLLVLANLCRKQPRHFR